MVNPRFLPAAVLFLTGVLLAVYLPGAELNERSSLTPIERLGKELFFDPISDPPGMSCASCHAPEVGWSGPDAQLNLGGAVYPGAVSQRFGNRRPPSSAYATFSPTLHYDQEKEEFVGGNFWDGRATGRDLGTPAADQAKGPFLNPVEHNNANQQAVCLQVAASHYTSLFEEVWGTGSLECEEPRVSETYDKIALSLAAYEASEDVNSFTSKFDYFLKGATTLTHLERHGFMLFN